MSERLTTEDRKRFRLWAVGNNLASMVAVLDELDQRDAEEAALRQEVEWLRERLGRATEIYLGEHTYSDRTLPITLKKRLDIRKYGEWWSIFIGSSPDSSFIADKIIYETAEEAESVFRRWQAAQQSQDATVRTDESP